VCAWWVLQIFLIIRRIVDRHTLISPSAEISFSRFLFFFIFESAENPCSQRYEVENGKKIVSTFIDISGYSSETYIQKLLKVVSMNLP